MRRGIIESANERYPHLKSTRAAVRWLSVEPTLGPIKFTNTAVIEWVVVGGESGSDQRMEKAWVSAIRDQCAHAKVPFFFKQWGMFDENGNKHKQVKKEGLILKASLDGVVHDAYPGLPSKGASEAAAATGEAALPKVKRRSAPRRPNGTGPKSDP